MIREIENMELTLEHIKEYQDYLYREEKSIATIQKYLRDIMRFYDFLYQDKTITKERVVQFKLSLLEQYKVTSINSMLVALNQFLKYFNHTECLVKLLKIQKRIFIKEDQELNKEEYQRLLQAARHQNNERLMILLQTLCGTGIRVSEHQYITVEAVKKGRTQIMNKGKIREIIFSKELRKILLRYCQKKHIKKGTIFITRSGKPLDRSNIFTSMKKLCHDARVDSHKVYPHNLRHLFAFTYYKIEKDLVRLADILGHSTIETTRIYTMTTGREYEKTLSKMNLVGLRI